MKLNFDKKKQVEAVADVLHKTTDVSKTVAASIQSGAKDLVDKTKNDNYLRRLKKYNPLFPEQYQNEEFHIPNMVIIVDDAVRRGIDVCEGAIGWIKQEKGMEILCLYDEAIEFSGLQFVPDAQCDAIYYVDRFDRNRFIKIECIFSRAQEEKIAELKNVAYSLGAKTCVIEISESQREFKESKKKFAFSEGAQTQVGQVSSQESSEQELMYKTLTKNTGKSVMQFAGSDEPKRPALKWFKNDDNINRLIDMRCENANGVKSETLTLEGSSSAVMSVKTAQAIDSTVGRLAKASASSNMESQAEREMHSKFQFSIEF